MKCPSFCALLTLLLAASAPIPQNPVPRTAAESATSAEGTRRLPVTLWLTVIGGGFILPYPRLTSDEVRVFEDGQEQSDASLSKEDPEPGVIGLLMQVSSERRNILPHSDLEPAIIFLHSVMIEGRTGFAETFSDHTEIATKPTANPEEMEVNLRKTDFEPRGCSALFDAIISASKMAASPPQQRRVLVVIADGNDNCSHNTLQDAIDAALRAQVRIYFLNLALLDLTDAAPGRTRGRAARIFPRQQNSMRLARPTGGTTIILTSPDGLWSELRGIVSELRTQRKLTYYSSNPAHDGKFRSIELGAHDWQGHILAPIGYFAPKD
jgi:VWFA-related protein